MYERLERQIELEKLHKEEGYQKLKRDILKAVSSGRFDETPFGGLLLQLGFETVRDKLQEYLDKPLLRHQKKQQNAVKLISEDPNVLSIVILKALLNMLGTGRNLSIPLSHAVSYLGKTLYEELLYSKLSTDNPKLKAYLGKEFRRASKKRKQYLLEKNIKELYDLSNEKTAISNLKVTTLLIELVEKSGANIIRTFLKEERDKRGNYKTAYHVAFTDEALEIMNSIDLTTLAENMIVHKPLVCKPKPFTTITDGGYYLLNTPLIIYKSYARNNIKAKDRSLDKIIPIINKLQEVPWRVNKRVYDIVKYIFENNTGAYGVPYSIPRTIEELCPKASNQLTKEEFARWNKERQNWLIRLDSEAGNRMEVAFALQTAEFMINEGNLFWYAYQLDYRGRVYPNESHLNHQKSKVIKSLLEFGEGQYLTPDGIWWLKVHIANTYGLDKKPYDERVTWVDEHYYELMQVASDPLGERSFIELADSPLEFIAACQAYNDHLSGDKVYLPIQLDATCSGIQMYSGLLRDEQGALSVNVIGDSRHDIYQNVADMAELLLQQNEYDPIVTYTDSEDVQHSVLTDKAANELRGNITRTLVKRPTMTVPYSVTKQGMRDQIYDELKALSDKGEAFWTEDLWVVNKILTDVIEKAIYLVVEGSRKGQEYLVSIAKSLDTSAIWYSPLYNFPIYQEAYDPKQIRIHTSYGKLKFNLSGHILNKRKQASRMAPNFIHSIDATILTNVIEHSDSLIGVIHDCFLVPPNSGYDVQELYKEAFVRVMEADPLRLIQQQLDPEETVPFPEYGELQLDEVFNAQYIIS